MKPFVDEKAYHVGSSVRLVADGAFHDPNDQSSLRPQLDLSETTRSVAAARARGLRGDCPGRRRVLACVRRKGTAFSANGGRRCSLPNSEL